MGIANTPYDFDNDAFDIEYGSYENLNYRGEGSIDIGILYTTKHLKTVTVYQEADAPGGFANYEKDFDSFYDDEENKVYLQFEIEVGYSEWDGGPVYN